MTALDKTERIFYELKNVGRNKWCGDVSVRVDVREHIEAAIILEAQKHLMSRDIDIAGNRERGTIFAGLRPVGTYERKP